MDNSTINITPWPIPRGQLNISYQQQLTATGGTGPYVWRVLSGALPFGLGFSTSGLFSGTVSQSSPPADVTVQVQDSSSPPNVAQKEFQVVFSYGAVVIVTTSLPDAVQGQSYGAVLQAKAGKAPYHWSQTAGALPSGLSLDDAGNITGTSNDPAAAFSVQVQVQDSEPHPSTAQAPLTLNLIPPAPPPSPPRPPHRMCETDPSLEPKGEADHE